MDHSSISSLGDWLAVWLVDILPGGRTRSVRGDELPEELSDIGSIAVDVAAYRAWPGRHPFVVAVWKELGIESGCYHDIAFRTGDCTSEVRMERK